MCVVYVHPSLAQRMPQNVLDWKRAGGGVYGLGGEGYVRKAGGKRLLLGTIYHEVWEG